MQCLDQHRRTFSLKNLDSVNLNILLPFPINAILTFSKWKTKGNILFHILIRVGKQRWLIADDEAHWLKVYFIYI